MKKSTQIPLFNEKKLRHFGGSFLKGNPKTKRPLSKKHSHHLILKSEEAMGSLSMLQKQNSQAVDRILRKQAQKCGVKIYHLVNVGNHLHLVIRITNRYLYRKYIRSVTGLIARHVLQKERGSTKITKKFWIARPFTRLIEGGKDYRNVANYMNKNHRQAIFIAWGFETTNLEEIYLLNTG